MILDYHTRQSISDCFRIITDINTPEIQVELARAKQVEHNLKYMYSGELSVEDFLESIEGYIPDMNDYIEEIEDNLAEIGY